jgi:hypothetical protein
MARKSSVKCLEAYFCEVHVSNGKTAKCNDCSPNSHPIFSHCAGIREQGLEQGIKPWEAFNLFAVEGLIVIIYHCDSNLVMAGVPCAGVRELLFVRGDKRFV